MEMNESKKILCYGKLAWFIVILLGFILIALVFKAGIIVGGLKSHLPSYRTSNHHENFKGHLRGGFINPMNFKKSKVGAFEARLESMGITVEEFKKSLIEQKKAEFKTGVENNK